MHAVSATRADTYTQRIEEHKGSANGNHLREQHDMEPEDIAESFRILKSVRTNLTALFLKCYFYMYKRTETNAEQTVRFNSRQIICLDQSLLRLL